MTFNNVINEYLKYFFVIGNMSVFKFIIKFVISLTSLIIKSAQQFEKIHIFYKILDLLQWDEPFFVKGKYLFVVGALGLGLGPACWYLLDWDLIQGIAQMQLLSFPSHFFFNREMLHPQYFYNIFTINHRWLVVIGSNLNLTLRLLFCPNNNNQ